MADEARIECPNCHGSGTVCENHKDKPWEPESFHEDACGCGAGMPCAVCCKGNGWWGDGTIPAPAKEGLGIG